jgi:hypothetical protein
MDGAFAKGTPSDADALFRKGIDLLDAECQAGSAEACVTAGSLMTKAADHRKDNARLGELWRAGCSRGDASACRRLAEHDPLAPPARVRELLSRACALGDAGSCADLSNP